MRRTSSRWGERDAAPVGTYLEFSDGYAQRTLSDLVREGDNVIVFRTFAKVYGQVKQRTACCQNRMDRISMLRRGGALNSQARAGTPTKPWVNC